MDEINTVAAFLSPGLPLWGIFLVVLVTAIRMTPLWMERWIAYLQAKHEARERKEAAKERAKEQDWARLREEIVRLDSRCAALEAREEECRTNLAAVREELATERAERKRLERLMMAEGEIRQAQAAAQAEMRADPAKATETRKRMEGKSE